MADTIAASALEIDRPIRSESPNTRMTADPNAINIHFSTEARVAASPASAGVYIRSTLCSTSAITRYQERISGPLLDCIEIHLDVPHVDYEKLSDTRSGEPSAVIRERVEAARERQSRRFRGADLLTNADMGAREVQTHCRLDAASDTLMRLLTLFNK